MYVSYWFCLSGKPWLTQSLLGGQWANRQPTHVLVLLESEARTRSQCRHPQMGSVIPNTIPHLEGYQWDRVKLKHDDRINYSSLVGNFFMPLSIQKLWSKKWQPSPVFLPGKAHGQKNLAGSSPQGHRVRHDWVSTHAHIQKRGVFW